MVEARVGAASSNPLPEHAGNAMNLSTFGNCPHCSGMLVRSSNHQTFECTKCEYTARQRLFF